jgi:hypothetical protein
MGRVFNVTPWPPFILRKSTLVPIGQEAGQAPVVVLSERLEEKSFRLCRESNLDRSVNHPVARHFTD